MELYHNQVTRVQGPFSLRLFHRSWGLMLIQANLDAPCTLLDYPTLDRFVEELRSRRYDIVGISGIVPNFLKVEEDVRVGPRASSRGARSSLAGTSPTSPTLPSGSTPTTSSGAKASAGFAHSWAKTPSSPSATRRSSPAHGTRTVGITARGETAATWRPRSSRRSAVPWVATSARPRRCSAARGTRSASTRRATSCSTSCRQLEANLKVQSFFMMDENFLLDRERALRLLELMERHDKAWALYLFSSASALRSYRIEQLVRLGLTWVWLGLEGEDSRYAKLHGADTRALVRRLQAHGIARARLDDHRAGGPHAGKHRRGDRARRAPRHRLSPVHALHPAARHAAVRRTDSAQGRMKDEQRIRACRHPWAVALQLPASAHPARPGDGTDRAGLPARFRGQRTEHRAECPDHAGRLEAVQGSSGSAGPPSLCLRCPGTFHRATRPWSPPRGCTTAAIPDFGPRWMRCSTSCTPSSA